MFGKIIKYIVYTIAGSLVFLVSYLFFLYYLFPYDLFEKQVVSYIENAGGVKISVGKGKVAFPIRMVWEDITITRDEESIKFDQFDISVKPIPLITKNGFISFELKGMEGLGSGTIEGSVNGKAIPYKLEVEGDKFYVKDRYIGYKEAKASGRLSLKLKNVWTSDMMFGKGFVDGAVSDLEFTNVEVGGFVFEKVAFPLVKLKAEFNNGKIVLKDIDASGDDFDLNGKGNITLKKRLDRSILNVFGQLTVKETSEFKSVLTMFSQGKRELKFSLTGSAARPRLKINNIPLGQM